VKLRWQGKLSASWLTLGIIVGSMLVLAALGLWTISARPFWTDEASSILSARLPLGALLDTTARDEPNMAFYYLVLHFWRLIGESELRIRLFSVLCAVATVPALYLLGNRLLGNRAALAGCALFATNAFVIEYSQQARGYTLVVLLVVLGTLLFLEAMKRESWAIWTLYGLVMAAALWTHFFAGFVLVAHARGFLTHRPRPRLLPAVPAIALAILAAAPIGLFIAFRRTTQIEWIDPTTPAAVVDAGLHVAGHGEVGLVLMVVLATVGLVTARRTGRQWAVGLLAAWVVVPLAGAILISLIDPVFIGRYLLFTAPAIALLAGAGLASARPVPAVLVGAAIVLAAGPPLAVYYPVPASYDDWRGAAAFVATYASPGDRIVYDDPNGSKPFGIYLERNRHAPLVTVLAKDASPAPRVWLIFWRRGYAETTAIRNGMGRYKATVNEGFGGVHVQLAAPR
jgi:mannosyltransferase